MAIESESDLLAFFAPAEFGTLAVIQSDAGDITVSGIMDTMAEEERPGANSRSGSSSFIIGASDVATQTLQFVTAWHLVANVHAENVLTIQSGVHAGQYRIKEPPQRDGEICRLQLNKR